MPANMGVAAAQFQDALSTKPGPAAALLDEGDSLVVPVVVMSAKLPIHDAR
jgi:hypothetical protein